MINLFETIDLEEQRILRAEQAGSVDALTVSLDPAIEVNDQQTDIFSLAVKRPRTTTKPLFFNRVNVPADYEIRSTLKDGVVLILNKKRAELVYYAGLHRIVKEVNWLTQSGNKALTEYYNKNGVHYATATYHKGKPNTKYFPGEQPVTVLYDDKEAIRRIEWQGKNYQLLDFAQEVFGQFLKEHQTDRIVINSLSTSFFVANKLPVQAVLLFAEQKNEIVGNMRFILEGKSHVKRIVLTGEQQHLQQLVQNEYPDFDLRMLSYVTGELPTNDHYQSAFVYTTTDQMPQLDQLIKDYPAVHFTVGAPTNMSDKLQKLGRYDNVSLYPNVQTDILGRIWTTHGIYLDINDGKEYNNATETALLHNMLILRDSSLSIKRTINGLPLDAANLKQATQDQQSYQQIKTKWLDDMTSPVADFVEALQ